MIKCRIVPTQWIKAVAGRTVANRWNGKVISGLVLGMTFRAQHGRGQRGVIKRGTRKSIKTGMTQVAVRPWRRRWMVWRFAVRSSKRAIVARVTARRTNRCVIECCIRPS